MAKFWIQYDAASGTYVPWEANTPPSPESVHRARFLSQFPAWIKYLSAMDGTEPYLEFQCWNGACSGVDHSFIYPARPGDTGENRHIGTVIQTAAFWNMLNWTPGDAWLDISEEQLVAGTTIDDGTAKLVESDSYAATEFDDIQAGDIIHPASNASGTIRQLLWKLRRRIDLCTAVKCGIARLGPVSGYVHINWEGVEGYDPYSAYYSFDNNDLPNSILQAIIGEDELGAGAVWNSVEGFDGWGWYSSRNISIQFPAGMPDESIRAAAMYSTDAFPASHPSMPFDEITGTARKIESVLGAAAKITPISADDYLITNKYETVTGPNYGYGDAVVRLSREGLAIPLATPHLDYLPLNSRFNDESAFSDLYNPA